MDYAVYQLVYGQDETFVTYLKGIDGGGLVKPYASYATYAWKLVEELMERYTFQLEQRNGQFRCMVYPQLIANKGHKVIGVGESEKLPLANCLSILDIHGLKEPYIKDTKDIEQDGLNASSIT